MVEDNVITNPVKAIKAKCIDCCCGSQREVKLCTAKECALYPFRMGRNPYRKKKELTEEQREALVSRLKQNQKQ